MSTGCFFLYLNQEDEGDVMSVCAEGSYQTTATRRGERARMGCMMGWTEDRNPISIQSSSSFFFGGGE